MNRKPPELPNIEDATLVACLAPLMSGVKPAIDDRAQQISGLATRPSGSNDNTTPPSRNHDTADHGPASDFRVQADDDAGAFRMIARFLDMTETELFAVATDFPTQISGALSRIADVKQRLAQNYDLATTAHAILRRAVEKARAAVDQEQPS